MNEKNRMTNLGSRLDVAVQNLGFQSLTDLLSSMPKQTYEEMNQYLGGMFTPMQIVQLQYEEAKVTGSIRNAARDALCRFIYERFPNGWGTGENSEYRQVSLLVDWASEIKVTGGLPELHTLLQSFRRNFKAPFGWKPSGPNDPILLANFNKLWP